MITALQRFLNRHRRWLFAALLAVVVLPFVFTIGASPGIVSGGKSKKIFGKNISSQEDLDALRREAVLGLYVDGIATASLEEAILAREAWDWVVRCLQVPQPDREILRDYVRSRPGLQEEGEFSRRRYRNFVHSLHADPSRSEAMAVALLGREWARNWTANVLASADFTLPEEARIQWRHLHTSWTLIPAKLTFHDFHPPLQWDEEQIREHFEANADRFRSPELLRLLHVFFSAGEWPESPIDDADLEKFFKSHGELFPSGDPSYLRDNRDAVVAAFRRWNDPAIAKGNEFLYRIYSHDVAADSPKIMDIVAELGGEARALEPFPSANPPQLDAIPAEALREAAALDGEHFFSNPFLTDAGVHIFILLGRIPPAERPFDEVRGLVERDLYSRERIRRFAQHARSLHSQLEQRMADGESFSAAAQAIGLAVEEARTFTLAELPEDILPQQIPFFSHLRRSETSEFFLIKPDLKLFYVARKVPPEDNDVDIQGWERENAAMTGQLVLRQFIEEAIVNELGGDGSKNGRP